MGKLVPFLKLAVSFDWVFVLFRSGLRSHGPLGFGRQQLALANNKYVACEG